MSDKIVGQIMPGLDISTTRRPEFAVMIVMYSDGIDVEAGTGTAVAEVGGVPYIEKDGVRVDCKRSDLTNFDIYAACHYMAQTIVTSDSQVAAIVRAQAQAYRRQLEDKKFAGTRAGQNLLRARDMGDLADAISDARVANRLKRK